MAKTIPIARPTIGGAEADAAARVIRSGWLMQGPKVGEFEQAFAAYVGARFACAVSSGTSALHLALLAVGVKAGDAVITASHSFIASANSIRHCGAEPVFIDIDPRTFNISAMHLERFLRLSCRSDLRGVYYRKRRIAALMPIHQMGMPCDIGAILPLAQAFGIPVVEDAACAIGSAWRPLAGRPWERIGRPHGDIASFSFHPRKVITTGEGGMITTSDGKYDRTIRLLRNHGAEVPRSSGCVREKMAFERYVVTGYNYRMTDIQAAVGIEQLKRLPAIIEARRTIAALYRRELGRVSWIELPQEPVSCRSNWQSYPVRITPSAPLARDGLMRRLYDAGVSTRRGIMNAHQEPPYAHRAARLRHSEEARDAVILLPIFEGMRKKDVSMIAELIKND